VHSRRTLPTHFSAIVFACGRVLRTVGSAVLCRDTTALYSGAAVICWKFLPIWRPAAWHPRSYKTTWGTGPSGSASYPFWPKPS
jgi:hypothetical protein